MIKILAAQIKEFKKDSILTPVFMLLEVVMEMIIPLLMASIIDQGVEAGNMQHILKIGAIMIVAAGVGLFAGVMGGKYGASASSGFAKNLRSGMFKNIQRFSFSNIDKFSPASLITRLTTDVTNLQNAYQMLLRMGTRAPASMLIAMVMSFLISPHLAVIYLFAVLFLGVIMIFLMNAARKVFSALFKKYDALNESVQENVSGIRVVKAYVREDYEKNKFERAAVNLYKNFLKAEKMMVVISPVMMGTVYTCILLISWFGAKMIVGSTLTTGQLMSLLTYCMNILMSLMMLSMVFMMITMSSASAERIAEVLTEKPSITNPKDPLQNVKDGSIEFKNVNFGYETFEKNSQANLPAGEKTKTDDERRKKYVLSDINLKIQSGETIGILGGTGSAKTSLVNLISRLYDVSEGEVLVGGENVKKYDLEVLRNQVAVVLQKNVLFSGTIYENLRWGDKNASDEECERAARLACADEFIDRLPDGYNTYIEQGGANVSGGQRQRLCIARALLKKPKILILDDSTSAVDTATDAKIRQAFRKEIPGTTKIIIAQRISSVMDADKIIVLDDGRINGFGTHEMLMKNNAIYKDVYESQTGGGTGDFDEKEGE